MSAANMVMSARSFAALEVEREEVIETVEDMPDTLVHKLEHCSICPVLSCLYGGAHAFDGVSAARYRRVW